MSKTIAELAKLLAGSNEQLYDRYISFRLSREKPSVADANAAYANITGKVSSLLIQGVAGIAATTAASVLNAGLDLSSDDFLIRCPADGIKPSITVSASLHVQNTANLITLTVVNMNANIDTMAYNYAEIEVGYTKSGVHTKFAGQITNCYMAKPNPNGELVVSVVCADIASMYKRGTFEVKFNTEFVTTAQLIRTCTEAICTAYPQLAASLATDLSESSLKQSIPGDWLTQTFLVNKATYKFRSPLECITWLNSLFASGTYNTGFTRGAGGLLSSFDVSTDKLDLPPLRLGFDTQGKLIITSTLSGATPGTVKALSCIGSAFLTGTESATVTAPFNPNISPGEVIYIDPKYFKTRVNVTDVMRTKYKNMGNLWYIIEMQFTFSTLHANTMTLMLNNINNKIKVGEG